MSEPIIKSLGITNSEKYLRQLCDKTFLSLWSFPNIFREEGKELCDLLVVFEKHVLIFSDKDCKFPESENLDNDWQRWFKRAVVRSAQQVWGAERWIKASPERLFLDPQCKRQFPYNLPEPENMQVHLIVVGHDASERCSREMGGSGSFMIRSDLKGISDHIVPFTIGDLDPNKSFIHVFDDTTLEIILRARDTISDFVDYLSKKEKLLRGETSIFAAGEEELLAVFLSKIKNDEHDFVFPEDSKGIAIVEGHWDEFQKNPQRIIQLKADEISYSWDRLIEEFSKHALNGTQYIATNSLESSEKILRFLAREPRTRRRMLARALIELLRKTPKHIRGSRYFLPTSDGDPFYVFIVVPYLDGMSEDEYRQLRSGFMEATCMVIKLEYPDVKDIVVIATESGIDNIERSEDAMYYNARNWTHKDEARAKELQKGLGLLVKMNYQKFHEDEYPAEIPILESILKSALPENPRNKPCPCNSGLKYKKCHGR